MQPDIVGFDRNGNLVLVAEVKNRRGASREWATQWRRNLLTHGAFPLATYFLIVLPDEMYLWKKGGKPDRPPDFTGKATRWISASKGSSESGLELATLGWLSHVTSGASDNELADPEYQWLIESGLVELLKGGRVEVEHHAR